MVLNMFTFSDQQLILLIIIISFLFDRFSYLFKSLAFFNLLALNHLCFDFMNLLHVISFFLNNINDMLILIYYFIYDDLETSL